MGADAPVAARPATGRAAQTPHHPRRPRHRRRRRRWWVPAAALGVLVALVTAAAAATVRATQAEMAAARSDVRRGADALLAADPTTAATAFARADERATTVGLRLSTPLMRALRVVPVVGIQLRTAQTLADASGMVARAGSELADGISDLEGGAAAIAPTDGRFPIDELAKLEPRLARAAELVTRARDDVAAADGALLVSQLRDGRALLLSELEPVVGSLDTAAALADAVPAFLGADGTRRYLFGAATPAELRGTGGLIGAYAPMTAHDGRVSFGDFVPASSLPRAPDDPPRPPSEDYQRRYGEFAAAGHWSNINMTPDFPTAAEAIERLHATEVGRAVDGTVVADPFALQLLLEATGPVDVDGVGGVRADTVVDYLTRDSYVELPDPGERKQILGRVAVTVFRSFLTSDAEPQRKARLLAEAVGGGHVLLHAADRGVQAAFERAEVAGALLPADEDFVAVVVNNAAGNKIDAFAERTVDYEVDLHADGTARGRLRTTIHNAAPASGLPSYVIGPSDDRFRRGENVMLLSTFCSAWCRTDTFRVDGAPTAIGQQTELGRQVLPTTVRVGAGETRELTHDWKLIRGWEAAGDSGTYRLTLQGQPTVRPTDASLRITVPDGMTITRVSDGLRVEGDEAVWQGTLGRVQRVEVTFAAQRTAWQRLSAALNRPLR